MAKKLGMYIHIPFCLKKCRYCDFCSETELNFRDYVDALKNEIRFQSQFFLSYEVSTLFFGGGTPSILPDGYITEIINSIKENFNYKFIETSIEGNPESLTEKKLKEFRRCGFNRLSIGVQSLNNLELKSIGRIHDSKKGLNAIENATKYFDNVSVDIMTGLPNQTTDSIKDTISQLSNFDLKHISCYSLILEDGTPLFNDVKFGKVILPDADYFSELWDTAKIELQKLGFLRYEVSNFAKKGFECVHNIGYWKRSDYLGLGAAAHSMIDNIRFYNHEKIKDYIENINNKIQKCAEKISDIKEKISVESDINNSQNDDKKSKLVDNFKNRKFDFNDEISEYKQNKLYLKIAKEYKILSEEEIRFEKIMLGLRLLEGVPQKYFEGYEKQLSKFKEFFNIKNGYVSLNNRGIDIMNSILLEFM